MKTRQHYYDNGLDKLELDVDQVEASLLRKMMDDEGPAAENDSGPQDTNAASKTGRERAVNLDPGSVDVDYDYENQVSAIAKSLHPVAPTVTAQDMPAHMPGDLRRQLFGVISRQDMDLEKVSLGALKHELTEDHHYWERAHRECFTPLQNGAKRTVAAGQKEGGSAGIRDIQDCYMYLSMRLDNPQYPMGECDICETLSAALLAEDANYTKAEREILASHLVANSRIGNRYARQFAKLAAELPKEADPLVDLIQDGQGEVVVMWKAKNIAQHDRDSFLEGSRINHSATLAAIQKEVLSNNAPLEARVQAMACAQKVAQVASLENKTPNILDEHATANRALMGTYPHGKKHQISTLIYNIARIQVSASERFFPKSLSPSRGVDPSR